MFEVVDGVADSLPVHSSVGVLLVEQHRHQPGLPVVAVDDIRAAIVLEQEFQRRLAEERKPADIVRKPVIMAAVEEIVRRMRLDEKTFAAVHEAEPDRTMNGVVVPRTMNGVVVPRHPKVLHGNLQAPDVVVAHAVILRQDNLHFIAADLQFPAQTEHHIPQPADLGDGRAFRSNLHDIHKRPSLNSYPRPYRAV